MRQSRLHAVFRNHPDRAVLAHDVPGRIVRGPAAVLILVEVQELERRGYTFPYLYDERQEVAKAYRAACTPDFFLFGQQRRLVYRGQFDDSRPGNDVPVTGNDLRAAVEAVLAGRPVPAEQKPSLGCNIKWKPGNAPDYSH